MTGLSGWELVAVITVGTTLMLIIATLIDGDMS